MGITITKYRLTAPKVFNGELIVSYKRGYLHQIEGLKYIGNQWETMCINKAIPYREHEIARIVEEHQGYIRYRKIKKQTSRPKIVEPSEAL